jgi:acetoin utilization deacetylase AcuC-like enzyme/GNAT superfamily N-acetyltransferase
MFSIRRIHDVTIPVNRAAIREVAEIFASHFAAAPQTDITELAEKLRNPFDRGFRTILYVAEKGRRRINGFAILLHEPQIGFCFLDYIATRTSNPGRGIGAALYEALRDEAVSLGAQGMFFECLPDAPGDCADASLRKQNAARLKFYETYGARPIIGTKYELPIPGGSADLLPHLVYDDLDRDKLPSAKFLRQVIRAILERKYGQICPDSYVEEVVASVREPVQLRPFRYGKSVPPHKHPHKPAHKPPHRPAHKNHKQLIAMVINDRHDIHHIRERGYVESPVRISVIRDELAKSGLFETVAVGQYDIKPILAVHDPALVQYLETACAETPEGQSVYPYVFPIRNASRPPKELSIRAGYYCIDTFTPINRNAFPAAKRAVDATLTAADLVLDGRRIAYSLVRPPGHHAEYRSFGGFCYFSNAAVAAHRFSAHGTVAILDIDYHHGNGQQDIFYRRRDVLTVSIHGDPDFAYPYFTGFADETGEGEGAGYNWNLPLPEQQDGAQYRVALSRAIERVRDFQPDFLVVCLGLDPAKGDPTGTWSLRATDFVANGAMIGELDLPTLVVQEGGYRTRTLGINAKSFFQGLMKTHDD